MAGNRAVAYMGPHKLEIKNLDYPKLVGPRGRKCDHGVILKLVVTNICGSDQHIYRGRFPAISGMNVGQISISSILSTHSPGLKTRTRHSAGNRAVYWMLFLRQ